MSTEVRKLEDKKVAYINKDENDNYTLEISQFYSEMTKEEVEEKLKELGY